MESQQVRCFGRNDRRSDHADNLKAVWAGWADAPLSNHGMNVRRCQSLLMSKASKGSGSGLLEHGNTWPLLLGSSAGALDSESTSVLALIARPSR